jgi:tRNA-dihydrouridine synthase B
MQSSIFKPVTLGSLTIFPNLVLSPMSGVTCSPFRRLIKELNTDSLSGESAVGLLVSEFISIEALTRNSRKSIEMMKFGSEEAPFGIQIFGYDIDRMCEAALMAVDAGADLLDINCGCPAPKVVRRGGGCELMRQPSHLQKMIHQVRKTVSIPFTIKFRSGWDENSKNALEIARIAEAEGVDGITIHGRTRSALYKGEADWDIVEHVASEVAIPVFGSGDITSRSGVIKRLYNSKISGVFIGRGAICNPLLFREILFEETHNVQRNMIRSARIVKRYSELLLEDLDPKYCVGKLKQLVCQMCKGQFWTKSFCRALSIEEQMKILQEVLDLAEDKSYTYSV